MSDALAQGLKHPIMDLIFLAFANSEEDPLPSLKEEDERVHSIIARRSAQGHFSLFRDSTVSIAKISEYLILYRDQLSIFVFSGHAGRDALFLEDDPANARGIAQLLGQCPNLKLVVLNGCSTRGQVDQLLQLESKPVVIATNAPVGDRAATQFSISFFQTLCEHFETIEAAFKAGIAAAQTASGQTITAEESRGIKTRSSGKSSDPLWGMYSEGELGLQWKLPTFSVYGSTSDYLPNVFLIRSLLESLAPYNEEVSRSWDTFSILFPGDTEITEEDTRKKDFVLAKKNVLACLSHPISEQLRKLVVEQQQGSEHTFYDKLGQDRLKQLVATYNTLIELMAFILLAQLWDELIKNPQIKFPGDSKEKIQRFFQLDLSARSKYEFLKLISNINAIFRKNQIGCFLEELNDAGERLEKDKDFQHACAFMETLKRSLLKLGRAQMEKAEAGQLCILAEEKLASMLGKLAFIVKYIIVSVQNIDVINYKHRKETLFEHKLVKFEQLFTELSVEEEKMKEYMDTSSVLLMKTHEDKPEFLNLSPFVIDENAFDEKAAIAKLRFFDRYEKAQNVYSFKHVYKPDEYPLVVNKQRNLQVIKEQFEAFSNLIFNQAMQAL